MVATGRSGHGFTLPEIMVSLVIVAVVAGVAAPSMKELISKQRVRAASAELYLALMRTRSEAIKLNRDVTLSSTGGQWHDGWTIQNPANSAVAFEIHAPLDQVSTNAASSSVVYMANGRVRGTTVPRFEFSELGAAGTGEMSCISVDLSGRPYKKSAAC